MLHAVVRATGTDHMLPGDGHNAVPNLTTVRFRPPFGKPYTVRVVCKNRKYKYITRTQGRPTDRLRHEFEWIVWIVSRAVENGESFCVWSWTFFKNRVKPFFRIVLYLWITSPTCVEKKRRYRNGRRVLTLNCLLLKVIKRIKTIVS